MKKAMLWIVGILLILIGLANSVNSVVAGFFGVIAGLLFLPPVIELLASKTQFTFLAKNAWLGKAIAAVLVVISFGLVSDAKDGELIAAYNSDPAKALSAAKQALQQKDFVLAKVHTEKYLKVLPNNAELKSLMAQIDSEKAETDKQAELAKQPTGASTITPKSEPAIASDGQVSAMNQRPADIDLFCSGMLTRASGLINENIGSFSGDDRRSFEQVSNHLSNNGMLLLQKGVLDGGDLENSNVGMQFANEKIGNNVAALTQDGSDQKKAIMGCLRRNN